MSFLDTVQKWAKDTSSSVQKRGEVLQAAKQLVDEGGLPYESKMIGKKASLDALNNYNTLVTKQLPSTIAWLEAATTKCKEAQTIGKDSCTPEELEEFANHERQYRAKVDALKRMCAELQEDLPTYPRINDIEFDAFRILQAKGKYSLIGSPPEAAAVATQASSVPSQPASADGSSSTSA